MRLRVGTVLVGHERESTLNALAKIDRIFETQAPDVVRSTVIVDNSLPRTEMSLLRPDVIWIGGDNSFREFTAWDRGLAQLDRMRERVDLVHLATSAFDSLYTGYLARFDTPLLKAASAAQAAVGHIDYYDDPIEIFGRQSQHWLRTSFVFIPSAAISALRSVLSFEAPERIFASDPERPFRAEAGISERYQRYILSWLTGEGTGQGVTWHSRFDLTHETLPTFHLKALAILNEHLLSLRLRELGYPVVDVAWLAHELAATSGLRIDWQKNWRDQISERPT